MKKRNIFSICLAAVSFMFLYGCSSSDSSQDVSDTVPVATTVTESETAAPATEEIPEVSSAPDNDQVASGAETAAAEEISDEGLTPVPAEKLVEGTYEITVDSSSSMFKVTKCTLTVSEGKMSAVITMSGKGYLYVYPGTGSQAAAADESEYIPFSENENGEHTFEVPVEALDKCTDCAAFSKNKEKWYERVLIFRSDALPSSAFTEGTVKTAADIGIADGEYTADVRLEGGSGRTSVQSPAKITVKDGKTEAVVVFNSKNYDYMIVDGVRYEAENTDETSSFTIPVSGFDFRVPVTADTVAMSTPHEIEYTLYFDSSSIS